MFTRGIGFWPILRWLVLYVPSISVNENCRNGSGWPRESVHECCRWLPASGIAANLRWSGILYEEISQIWCQIWCQIFWLALEQNMTVEQVASWCMANLGSWTMSFQLSHSTTIFVLGIVLEENRQAASCRIVPHDISRFIKASKT